MRIRSIIQIINIATVKIGLYNLTNTDIPVYQICFVFGFIKKKKANRQMIGWGEG